MREIRLALLEADVNFKVVKDFVARVRERALGADVTKSLTPGQEVVRIVHDELTTLMGTGDSKLAFASRPPTVILLAGLQGSGKTTAAAKLALLLRKEGHTPALVAADLAAPGRRRPARAARARAPDPGLYRRQTPFEAVTEGIEQARSQGKDVVILDTAGRLHVDEALMEELDAVRKAAKPTNVLLVLDAMTGQEAVSVAEAFQERIAFDGVVLTKLDGDARGGAALSVKAVTGKPIKLASIGEKLDQLEYFHPDRMASRILGMGDVLTLIEKAEEAADEDEQARLEQQMLAGEFTFDDFLTSYKMLRRMGPLKGVLSMIPGLGKQLQGLDVNEKDMRPRRGDRALDDAEGTAHAAPDRRLAPEADRGGQRDDDPAGQPAAFGPKADAEDDEADEKGQDAGAPTGAAPASAATTKEIRHGSTHAADPRRVEEESDLPRRRGRLALAARRQVHRDRRPLQPADRSVDDRLRRGQGQGVAREGRHAVRTRSRAC